MSKNYPEARLLAQLLSIPSIPPHVSAASILVVFFTLPQSAVSHPWAVTLWAAEIFWGKRWQEKKHVGVSDLVPKKCRYFSTHKNKEGEENFWDQQCRLRQIDGFQFENPVCAPPPALPVSPFRSAAANLPHRGAADPPLRPAPLPALQLPPPHSRAAAAASQPRPSAWQLGRGGRAGGGRNCHAGRSPPAQQRWVQPATHLRMCVTKYGSWDESPD